MGKKNDSRVFPAELRQKLGKIWQTAIRGLKQIFSARGQHIYY
jgi:hypothetical protein